MGIRVQVKRGRESALVAVPVFFGIAWALVNPFKNECGHVCYSPHPIFRVLVLFAGVAGCVFMWRTIMRPCCSSAFVYKINRTLNVTWTFLFTLYLLFLIFGIGKWL